MCRGKLAGVLAAVAMAGMLLSGCGGNGQPAATQGKVYRIAVLLPGETAYFTATRQGIDEAAKDRAKIYYADALWEADKQLAQARQTIAEGVDLIAVCAVDAGAGEKIVQAAQDAKIPVLVFTNAIGSNEQGLYPGVVSYVGQNEVRTGALTGEIAKKLLGEAGGNAILIEGVLGTAPQINRKKGLEAAIVSSGIRIVYRQPSHWQKEQAHKIVEDAIRRKLDFQIVICQDDNSATGAGEALQAAGMKDRVKVVGLGGSKEGLQAVKDGLIDGTTYMSAAAEGRLAIDTALRYLDGEKVGPIAEIKQVAVNSENVGMYHGEW